MGQSRGYVQQPSVTPEQAAITNFFLNKAKENTGWSSDYFRDLAQGGGHAQDLQNSAIQAYTRAGLPNTLNQFGSSAPGSSSLNQALAAGQGDLSTQIASILGELGMQGAQNAAGMGQNLGGLGLGTQQFQNIQKPIPGWAQILGTLGNQGLNIGTMGIPGLGGAGQSGSIFGNILNKMGLFKNSQGR